MCRISPSSTAWSVTNLPAILNPTGSFVIKCWSLSVGNGYFHEEGKACGHNPADFTSWPAFNSSGTSVMSCQFYNKWLVTLSVGLIPFRALFGCLASSFSGPFFPNRSSVISCLVFFNRLPISVNSTGSFVTCLPVLLDVEKRLFARWQVALTSCAPMLCCAPMLLWVGDVAVRMRRWPSWLRVLFTTILQWLSEQIHSVIRQHWHTPS